MQITTDQILAAAVGKAIADNVTPELTAQVFTAAFGNFMNTPVNVHSADKTTRAGETLHSALKLVLTERAREYLEEPEQRAVIDAMLAQIFQELIGTDSLQQKIRDTVIRTFQNTSFR